MSEVEKSGQMVDTPLEVQKTQDEHHASSSEGGNEHISTNHTRPNGWIYKSPTIFGKQIPWLASPKFQLAMVSIVCFLCPGMFNAVNGLGGGGQVDQKPAADANTALYTTFSVVGFFAGTIANKLGIRLTLSFGGFGYSLYVAALLCYNHTQNSGFLIFAGAMLGVCAGLLWTAQGAIMMSYPPEDSKGRYISWFWMIFNMGAVIGSLIPLGQNINVQEKRPVNDGTYIGFIVLMIIGATLGLFLVDAGKVIREDGSKVILMKNPTWKSEFLGLWDTIRTDSYIILLFPMFFASNWFYTYQFNAFNGAHFNTRTGALNNTLYWISQILGAFVFGYLLDLKILSRSMRAKGCWVALMVLTMAIWGGGYAWQKDAPPREVVASKEWKSHMDWENSGYIGPMFLYVFYGFYDAAWQTAVYWLMGALSNSGRKSANFAGFYKGIQSAGAAVIWALDGNKISYDAMFGSSWGLLAASLVIAAPVIFIRIKDHNTVEEDLKGTDETIEDVLPEGHIEKQGVHTEGKV